MKRGALQLKWEERKKRGEIGRENEEGEGYSRWSEQ